MSIGTCPLPLTRYPHVMMAHGGGGKLMQQLIETIFVPAFGGDTPSNQHDGAFIHVEGGQAAFTTDSFVVQPLFFPGGDIGKLAIYGTVNDLAMCGAEPRYVSVGFILEEGLDMETLWRVAQSMGRAARETQVQIVTGDTKVVERGKGDGLFINTSGVGRVSHALAIGPSAVQAGDAVLVSGDLGRHGIAIMAARQGISFERVIESDAAPLAQMVLSLLAEGLTIHCLRDLTRGGLASTLNEIATARGLGIEIEEERISVHERVRGACELLGLDPLYVANEGRFALFVPQEEAQTALRLLRAHSQGRDAAIVGRVLDRLAPRVTMVNGFGTSRVIDLLAGDQLPRIC